MNKIIGIAAIIGLLTVMTTCSVEAVREVIEGELDVINDKPAEESEVASVDMMGMMGGMDMVGPVENSYEEYFTDIPPQGKVEVSISQKDENWVYDYVIHNIGDPNDPTASSIYSFDLPYIWMWDQKAIMVDMPVWDGEKEIMEKYPMFPINDDYFYAMDEWFRDYYVQEVDGVKMLSFLPYAEYFDAVGKIGSVMSPEGWECYQWDGAIDDNNVAYEGIYWADWEGVNLIKPGQSLGGFQIETPFQPGMFTAEIYGWKGGGWGTTSIEGPVPEDRVLTAEMFKGIEYLEKIAEKYPVVDAKVEVSISQKEGNWVYDYIIHNIGDPNDPAASSIYSFDLPYIWMWDQIMVDMPVWDGEKEIMEKYPMFPINDDYFYAMDESDREAFVYEVDGVKMLISADYFDAIDEGDREAFVYEVDGVKMLMFPPYTEYFDAVGKIGSVMSPEGWECYQLDGARDDNNVVYEGIYWADWEGVNLIKPGQSLGGFQIKTPFQPGMLTAEICGEDGGWCTTSIEWPVPENRVLTAEMFKGIEYLAGRGDEEEYAEETEEVYPEAGDVLEALMLDGMKGEEVEPQYLEEKTTLTKGYSADEMMAYQDGLMIASSPMMEQWIQQCAVSESDVKGLMEKIGPIPVPNMTDQAAVSTFLDTMNMSANIYYQLQQFTSESIPEQIQLERPKADAYSLPNDSEKIFDEGIQSQAMWYLARPWEHSTDYGSAPSSYQNAQANVQYFEWLGNGKTINDGVVYPIQVIPGENISVTFDISTIYSDLDPTMRSLSYAEPYYVQGWIDWDQNGSWENSELAFNWNKHITEPDWGPIGNNYTGTVNFTVPGNAVSGETWMRTWLNYSTPLPTPGGIAWRGEIEDYEINTVPEPATLVLLGSGLLGIAGIGRRKGQKKIYSTQA